MAPHPLLDYPQMGQGSRNRISGQHLTDLTHLTLMTETEWVRVGKNFPLLPLIKATLADTDD